MAHRVQCPKCQSDTAWYECDHQDVWLHCLCGYYKVVATVLADSMTIEHLDAEEDVTLPRRGSKLFDCLAALVGMREATTGEIAEALNFGRISVEVQSNSDVASQLTVLRYKGLVKVADGKERKGVRGGSMWEVTPSALRLFKGVT